MVRALVVLFEMCGTRVSDLNDFVCNSVLSVRDAGINSVNVIDATANRVLLNDSDAHVGVVDGMRGRSEI